MSSSTAAPQTLHETPKSTNSLTMSNDPCSIEEGDEDFSSHGSDFTFGFNDSRFSDRVLIVEILATADAEPDSGVLRPSENECSKIVKLNVSTILLAAKSAFFRKLFTNGMMESEQRSVSLRINADDESAFMELMAYMYGGSLASKSEHAILDILKLADRFQVVECKKLCASLLRKLPLSTDSALLYLTYTTLCTAEGVQTLTEEAKKFVETRYKDVDCGTIRNEIMELPLVVIQAILSSNDLRVPSEDGLFDIAMKWVEVHYPKLEDQRKVFSQHLARYIRFDYMSLEKLEEVLTSSVLYEDFARKAVTDALFSKIKAPHHHHRRSMSRVVRRDYKRKPVKLVEFDFPCKELLVYFELPFDECSKLKPSQHVYSEVFCFGERRLYMYAQCQVGRGGRLRFVVGMGVEKFYPHGHDEEPFILYYYILARSKYRNDYYDLKEDMARFSGRCYELSLFEKQWPISEDGRYGGMEFIDGVLYLKLELRVHNDDEYR